LDSPVQFSPSVICDECNEDELFQWEVLVDLYGDWSYDYVYSSAAEVDDDNYGTIEKVAILSNNNK